MNPVEQQQQEFTKKFCAAINHTVAAAGTAVPVHNHRHRYAASIRSTLRVCVLNVNNFTTGAARTQWQNGCC